MQRRCKDLEIKDGIPINLEQVTDLDDIFTKKYGRKYVDDPKLRKLAEINNITLQNFVDGKEEIRLFHEKEYKKIENSTNRKVNVIADYLSAAFNNQLEISANRDEDKYVRESSNKSPRKSNRNIIIVIVAIATIVTIFVGVITIYEFVEERIDNENIDSTQDIPQMSSEFHKILLWQYEENARFAV